MKKLWKAIAFGVLTTGFGVVVAAELSGAQLDAGVGPVQHFVRAAPGATRTVFMTAYEVKGTTTIDKLAAPTDNPADVSKGYGYKAPGHADKAAPHKWEVASYMFNPASVTVQQGDAVDLTVFVVNGDEHEAWVTAPDGRIVVPKTKWVRGREYRAHFRAEEVGAYQLVCSSHAPSMMATFLVLAR